MSKPTLRSVNLREDAFVPSRLDHYKPTSRSLPVAAAVLAGGASMVIAAYGSGKSLAAGIGAMAVDNDPANKRVLAEIAGRIEPVDPEFAKVYEERAQDGNRGRVVVLSGYVRDVARSLASSLDIGQVDDIEQAIAAMRRLQGIDHIAIVWDEFGRHLEGLVTEGRSRDLDIIQRLAEFTVRAKSPTVGLTILLHQNLLAYAGSLNQTTRNEWRKIEGRFRQVRFVEDSRELYALVASVVDARRPPRKANLVAVAPIAQGAVEARWFDGIEDPKRIISLLTMAHPISGAALQVLPRLVARVGQNERSLFAFLESIDTTAPVGLDEVYLAFSESLRSDVGVGGLHRRWVEAESARSKVTDAVEREALSAAFMLQIGAHGERRHLPRSILELAVRSKGHSSDSAEAAVEALIERKLLLYRKLNDDISIWHGADLDVASRLRDERIRRITSFDLSGFLEAQHPAPFLRPSRHNAEHGTSRYMVGSYVQLVDLASIDQNIDSGIWGRVIYVICNSGDDVRKAASFAEKAKFDRTILVVPADPVPAFDTALEIECLTALRKDSNLLSEDPLVVQELDELLAVARRQLTLALHRLTSDRPNAATWFHLGKRLEITPERPAGIMVSDLMDEWFPLTPRIVNDQIMRGRVSRQMQTARVRAVLRLMEQSTKPNLGYAEDDSSAEASVFRTIFARTGIHRSSGDSGRFASPAEIRDPGLADVWEKVQHFFTEPGRKPLTEIVEVLSAPPYGLPSGVLPLIVLAGYRAFGRAVSLWTDGNYVADVLGFEPVRMFVEPERHMVEVHTDDPIVLDYLAEVSDIFLHKRPGPHDEMVRFARDALRAWRSSIADGATRSKRMTDDARQFLRAFNEATDPATFLVDTLPNRLGDFSKGAKRYSNTLRALEKARNVIDGLVDGYLRDAVEVLADILRVGAAGDVVDGIRDWISCLDVADLMRRDDLKMTDKAILRTARDTLGGRYSPETLARTVSSVLLQRGIEKWQDDTGDQLRKELRECKLRIEAAAMDVDHPPAALAPVIEARIRHLQGQLARIRSQKHSGGATE
ncbi:hypothetical protein FQV39_04485 [Bosea sp. F3-2]|uniref:hypothetical protein n=1 Tax=Bosea sp. F3-2 TaxID=2599640 RepID=UPI0011F0905C|nr:hypothetical protein [Bosea sp. F3-2]QEL21919.1 hypothetical protein FQV39_04485 [Bosea sp. F3-2]